MNSELSRPQIVLSGMIAGALLALSAFATVAQENPKNNPEVAGHWTCAWCSASAQ
jgi:hypothetical protein